MYIRRMTAGWNFAEMWEHHGDRFGDATAEVQGDYKHLKTLAASTV